MTIAAAAGLSVWLGGGVGYASDAPEPQPAGLISDIEPQRLGRTETLATLQCPATPPTSCRDYQGYWDMGVIADNKLNDLWTVPGDIVDFHAAFIACLPTDAPGWTSTNKVYLWTKTGFPNPKLTEYDQLPSIGWRDPDNLPSFPLFNSEGNWKTNVPMTSDWTIDSVTREMHNQMVRTTGPLAMETSTCDTRNVSYSISGSTPSIYLMVFDPEITLKKYVCLPGADCSGSDPRDTDVWADAGTSDDIPSASDAPGPFVDGQTVTWLIEVTNTGTVDLQNVRIPSNDPSEMGDQLSGVMAGHETSCEGLIAGNLPAGIKGGPGGVAYKKCTTTIDVDGNTGGTLRNDAQALADVDPELVPEMAARIGNDIVTVRSDSDPALVQVVVPKLELLKEVCVYGDRSRCDPDDDALWLDANWDDDTPPTAGVDYPVIPEMADATWRITVTNVGETDVADVRLSSDLISGGGQRPEASNCLSQDPGVDILRAGPAGKPGEKYWFTCATPSIVAKDGPTVNEAQATGTPVSVVDDEPVAYQDAEGNDLVVKSNVDTAVIDAHHPEIELKKYACKSGTGCDPHNLDEWADTGTDPTLGEDDEGYVPYDPMDRVWVESGSRVEWLIVAKNTGNVALSPVQLTDDQLSGAGSAQVSNDCATPRDFPLAGAPKALLPQESTSLTCTTGPVTENGEHLSLTNTAQATGTAVDDEGETIDGIKPAQSNKDMANVAAAHPHLQLKKYACTAGTQCELPASAEAAAQILAGDDTQWSDAQDSEHAVYVEDGTDVQWLILVKNDGSVDLKDVALSTDVLTIDGTNDNGGAAGCTPGTEFTELDVADGVLAPEGFSYLTCSTTVHSTHPTSDVVNSAAAAGQALNPDYPDNDVPLFDNEDGSTVTTDVDPAHVVARSPQLELTKWVCAAGQTCNATDYKSATDTGPWVKSTQIPPGTDATWLIAVRNTGNVDLVSVSVSAEFLTAAGNPARSSDAEACAASLQDRHLAKGEIAVSICTSADVARSQSPLVNTAAATGTDSFGTTVDSDPDAAEVTVPDPTPIDPGPTSTPPTSETPTPTQTATPTATPTATSTASPTAPATASPTATASASPSISPTATPSASPTATQTPGPAPSCSHCATPTPVPSNSVSPPPPPTPTPGSTSSPSVTPPRSPSASPTVTPTASPTPPATTSPTATASASASMSPTATPSASPTATQTPGPAPSCSHCATPTPVPSNSVSPPPPPTPTPGSTSSPSGTPTTTPTATPSGSVPITPTATPSGSTGPTTELPTPPAPSNVPSSTSTARADGKGPGLSLTKQACRWGTVCDAHSDSDWVSTTTQPENRTATWRIIVANTGSEALVDIAVDDQLSKTRGGSEASCEMSTDAGDALQPGYRIVFVCASAPVTAAESGLVNTARATATGQTTGVRVVSLDSSAKVLVAGAPGTTLPLTGVTLGAAGVALALVTAGMVSLWLRRRGSHTDHARHVA